jgi:hypothetical protein
MEPSIEVDYALAALLMTLLILVPIVGIGLGLYALIDAFTVRDRPQRVTRIVTWLAACVNALHLALILCLARFHWILCIPGFGITLTILAAWRASRNEKHRHEGKA